MSKFTLLWEKILDSSLWEEAYHVRIVWIAILAMKNNEGKVLCTTKALSRRANVTLEECQEAIKKFLSPDADPARRNDGFQGRRLEVLPDGWMVINHEKYQFSSEAKREYWRQKKAEQRMREDLNHQHPKKKITTLRDHLRQMSKNDPITKADKASMRKLMAKNQAPKEDFEPTEFEKEYDIQS